MIKYVRRARVETRIPTASMANMAFLLLMFFLLTAIFHVEQALVVRFPKAVTGQKIPKQKITHIWIDSGCRISIDDRLVTMEDIEPIIGRKWHENPDLIVDFNVDRSVPYPVMNDAVDRLKRANALSAVLSTEKGFSRDP